MTGGTGVPPVHRGNSSPMQSPGPLAVLMLFAGGILVVAGLALLLRALGPYRAARREGITVALSDIWAMQSRKSDVSSVLNAAATAVREGLNISVHRLEDHWRAGGHPVQLVQALASAKQAGLALDTDTAANLDLAGADLQASVQAAAASAGGVATVDWESVVEAAKLKLEK